MKRILKKQMPQLLAVLLAVTMITCFIPQTAAHAYAESGDPVVGLPGVLGTGVNTDNAQTVYYGADIDENNNRIPVAWRVISYDGTGNEYTKPAGAMTLFAADILRSGIQFNPNTNDNNEYAGSNLKSVVDGLYGSLFSTKEQSAIESKTLNVGEYSNISPYSTGVSGTETSGYLWPLSTAEALALPSDKFRSASGLWWLCSPGLDDNYAAYVVPDGLVSKIGDLVGRDYGVRPAFNLNLSSVLFTSAAEGGKSSGAAGDGSLEPVSANSTGEWKLTMHDSNLDAFKASAATNAVLSVEKGYPFWNVRINCKIESDDPLSVIPEPNEQNHVSAILADSSDNALYYGVIDNESHNGTKDISIPTGLAAGKYKLHVFLETTNGDKFTDYSSAFRTINLTVTAPPVETHSVTVNNGNGSGEYAKDAEVKITAAAPEEGMQFKEWTGDVGKVTFTEGSKTTAEAKFKMPAEALTFEATYETIPSPPAGTHSVTVNNGNGSGDYAEGESVTITAAAPEEGMQFKEWTGDVDKVTFTEGSKTTSTAKFNMPAEDLSFEATYEAVPVPPAETCTVTFKAAGGTWKDGTTADKKVTVEKGKAATAPAKPTRKGYTFSGWDKGFSNVTTDLTVTAKWKKNVAPPQPPKPVSIKGAKVVLSAASFTYNGKVRRPYVKTVGGKALKAGTDFTAKWSNASSKDVGAYTVTITGKGKYTGTTKATYRINPVGTDLKKVKKAKKAVTVKWKKQKTKMSASRITGYQIQLATDSRFTENVKNVYVKGYAKKSKKVKKLKGKTRYYVHVRTYKTVNGANFYSPWSATKSVKTKK